MKTSSVDTAADPSILRSSISVWHSVHRRHRPTPVDTHATLHVSGMMTGYMPRRRSMGIAAATRTHAALPKVRVIRVNLVANAVVAWAARGHSAHFVVVGVAVVLAAAHQHMR